MEIKGWRQDNRKSGRFIGFVAAILAVASVAGSQSKMTIPPSTGVVNDFAHVLDPATIQRITRIAEDVRSKSRGEMAVVTLSDIGQNPR